MVPSSHSGGSAPGNQTSRSPVTLDGAFLGGGGGGAFFLFPKGRLNRAWNLPVARAGLWIWVPKKYDVAADVVVAMAGVR